MEFKNILQAFQDCDYEPRSYSGRAMYGKKCLGVVDDEPQNVAINVLCEYVRANRNIHDVQDLAESLKGQRHDSMGLSGIVYFPNLIWEDIDDSEDDEEENEEE